MDDNGAGRQRPRRHADTRLFLKRQRQEGIGNSMCAGQCVSICCCVSYAESLHSRRNNFTPKHDDNQGHYRFAWLCRRFYKQKLKLGHFNVSPLQILQSYRQCCCYYIQKSHYSMVLSVTLSSYDTFTFWCLTRDILLGQIVRKIYCCLSFCASTKASTE